MSLASKTVTVPRENQLNAVIYARFSSERQTENSIEFQLRADKAYCEQKGFRVIGEYIDRAMTGTNDNRPEFQRMIADAKKRQFAFIVVYRFDRFARNRYDSAIYKKQLERSGVRVLSTEESVGTGDEGIILESIYEAMAESYSRKLSRIVTEGMKQKAIAGLSTGGKVPFGYKIVDHRLAIDEEKAPAVRLAFEMYADGKTKSEIMREMNSRGCRTQQGNKITVAFVTRMLENQTFMGTSSFCGVKRDNPAIISPELFDKVQDLLKKNKQHHGKRTDGMYFALTGKVFCGHCGAAMIGDSGTGKSGRNYYYYSCINKKKRRACKKKSERQDWLEKYVCEQTVNFVLAPKNISYISKRVAEASAADLGCGRIAELEREIARIDRQFDALTESLIKTTNPTFLKKINEKAEALTAQKEAAEKEHAALCLRRELCVTPSDVEMYLRSFAHGDPSDPDYRRRLINTLVNAVYVWDDKILIYYNYNVENNAEMEFADVCKDADKPLPPSRQDASDHLPLSPSPSPATAPTPPKCSDSLTIGSPKHKLSELIDVVFYNGLFGAIISRG